MNKIHCHIVEDLLPLFADEAASEETVQMVEEHLAECEHCRTVLEALRKNIPAPSAPEKTAEIQKFQKKWNLRQFWKGAGITLAVLAVLAGGFLYAYVRGFPASSEDILLRSGFQCYSSTELDPYTGEYTMVMYPEKQEWILDMHLKKGAAIRDSVEFLYETDPVSGEERNVGMVIHVRRTPFIMPWDSAGKVRTGFVWPEDMEITENSDYTIKVVFSDKTVVYSMREEGLFTRQEHTGEFCPFCS